MTVSLRLPKKTKRRLPKHARARGTSVHAVMVNASEDHFTAQAVRAVFYAEATQPLAELKRGEDIPASKVCDYMGARFQGKRIGRPKARKLR